MSNQEYYNAGSSSNTTSQPSYSQGSNQQFEDYTHQGAPHSQGNNPTGSQYQNNQASGIVFDKNTQVGGPEGNVGPDGERGIGATVVGGGGAAWAAHKAGGGLIGSAVAGVAGAIGANVLENLLEKKKKKHGRRHH